MLNFNYRDSSTTSSTTTFDDAESYTSSLNLPVQVTAPMATEEFEMNSESTQQENTVPELASSGVGIENNKFTALLKLMQLSLHKGSSGQRA